MRVRSSGFVMCVCLIGNNLPKGRRYVCVSYPSFFNVLIYQLDILNAYTN